MNDIIEIPILKVRQHETDMFVGVINANDLYATQTADRIRLEGLEIPKYAGYQRALVQDRVDSIKSYIKTPSSTFPNSIIVSIDSEMIENWDAIGEGDSISILKIKKQEDVFTVIDGQHRAAALEVAPIDFKIIITIFVDLLPTKAAEIFTKINSTQKPVNPSIAFQLFGYSEFRSPQKVAHEIAETLNTKEGSPFYKKLRMLGTKDNWSQGGLSQSTFAKQLMLFYTKDYVKDEYEMLRGDKLQMNTNSPLRKYFVDGKDDEIMKIYWIYFYTIATTWPEQWKDNQTSILVKTTGYISFAEVLRKWLLGSKKMEALDKGTLKQKFDGLKDKYNEAGHKFLRANYPAGNQGVIVLRNKLLQDLEIN